MKLSEEQKYAFEKFKQGENLFITGPGGTGKTKLIHHLVNHMIMNSIKFQVCAMTGCAAVLLGCNARTLHSWSGIKLAKGDNSKILQNILRSRRILKSWKKVKVLIVDEVSMMSKKIFELIDQLARSIHKKDVPFGGMQVIFTGDFFQLPPVGEDDADSSRFAFESAKWFQVFTPENNIQLTTLFRQTDDLYKKILMEIRCGEISEESKEILRKHVKREYTGETIPTKLFPIKSKVDFVNNSMFAKLETEECHFKNYETSSYTTYLETNKLIEPEHLLRCQELTAEEKEYELELMNKNIGIEKDLCLKVGATVMCTFNIDLESGICNGSQGVIVSFVKKYPTVKFSNGIEMTVPYQYYQNEEYPTLVVGQIPLCLAWAMTIHKIQGATLDIAEMDLGKSIFEYGQSYVALSRIRSLNGLYLSEFYPHRIKANPLVKLFYDGLHAIPTSTSVSTTSTPTSTPLCFENYRYVEEKEGEPEPVATNVIVAEAIAEPIVMATIDASCVGFTGTSGQSNIKIVKL